MCSNDIITEGKFSNLRLYTSELRLLDNIEKIFHSLKYDSCCDILLLSCYTKKYFDKFFLDLDSERSKGSIKLFDRENNQNSKLKMKFISLIYV
nr:P52 family lipoprotein [Borreliella finlandensis]